MHESGTSAAVGSASSATCAIKLSLFEGPLDLLLHLIRENEMDITELSVADVADQYVEYLNLMQELQLDVAGEYLLMAATLAWIKSRLILPPSEDGEESDGPDPRAELVARLLEYERFKEAAEKLGEFPREGRDVFKAQAAELAPTPEAEREIEVSLLALLDAFRKVLARVPQGPGLHEVEADQVTVYERMVSIMDQVGSSDASLEFEQLFVAPSGAPPSRALVVATFLALLELVRVAALRVYQGVGEDDGVPTGPIRLRRSEEGADEWRRRIAEDPRAVEGL
ncbi:MAG: segregation/condensation protein A [Deltaproteobacteria bacterium]|nr:segregation/condensation protein A [Deltaproteobacteria bacterium]